jgi:hypothetical protein
VWTPCEALPPEVCHRCGFAGLNLESGDGAAFVAARKVSLCHFLWCMADAKTPVIGPTLPTWALQQSGSYLGYTGRAANAVGKAAVTPPGHCRPFAAVWLFPE